VIRISHDYRGKWLIGHGDPNFQFYRTSGRVHIVESMVIRWRGMGGTVEKPNVTVIAHCGGRKV
jgi:hypothetical protein